MSCSPGTGRVTRLGEGGANTYCTPSDEAWREVVAPTMADPCDAACMADWVRRLRTDRERLPDLLRQRDSVLGALASGQGSPEAMAYAGGWTTPGPSSVRLPTSWG